VFSEGFDSWWPRQHSIVGSPQKQAVIECREGGRWYEVGEDGSICEWGKVLTWSPPDRLVLAWQIDGAWHFNPDFLTEIEIVFTSEGENRTTVQLEHRYLERYEGTETLRRDVGSVNGWSFVLGLFAGKAESDPD
jgi:uncharacterized protein YndB with AHSA1/START domain